MFTILLCVAFASQGQKWIKLAGGAGDTVGVTGTVTKYFSMTNPDLQIFSMQVHIDSTNGTPVSACTLSYSNDKTNWTTHTIVNFTGVGIASDTNYYISETTGAYYRFWKVYIDGSGGRSTVAAVVVNAMTKAP